jgi:hypothetical protein
MSIGSIVVTTEKYLFLEEFSVPELQEAVVLKGENGSSSPVDGALRTHFD